MRWGSSVCSSPAPSQNIHIYIGGSIYVCMHMYVYVCVYTHTHTHTHTHTYIYINTYTYTYIYIYLGEFSALVLEVVPRRHIHNLTRHTCNEGTFRILLHT